MYQKCTICKKGYPNVAALNFHTRRSHREGEIGKEQIRSSQEAKSKTQTNCRMLKFGKIQGIPDHLSGPFMLLPFIPPVPGKYPPRKTIKEESKEATPPRKTTKNARANKKLEIPVEPFKSPDTMTCSSVAGPSTSVSVAMARNPNYYVEPETDNRKKIKVIDIEYDTSISSQSSVSEEEESGMTKVARWISSIPDNVSSPDQTDGNSVVSTPTSSRKRGRPKRKSGDGETPSPNRLGPKVIGGVIQPCPICGKSDFRNANHFTNHIEIHEGKRPYVCPQCGFGYETDVQLLEHVSLRHAHGAAFDCNKCGNSFKTRRGFRSHKCK